MSSERLWIVLLALTSFFAGLAGGLLVSIYRFPAPTTGSFSEYERRLTEEFGLTPERAQRLHQILSSYDADLEALIAGPTVQHQLRQAFADRPSIQHPDVGHAQRVSVGISGIDDSAD